MPCARIGSQTKPDYCSNHQATFVYRAFYNQNINWDEAVTECRKQSGCLARPFNPSYLKQIQQAFHQDSVHGPKIYWVGVKYDKGTHQFRWDNGKEVRNTEAFSSIVNKSEQRSMTFNKRCLTATEDAMLRAADCRTTTIKFICQVPINSGKSVETL